ncbi:HDOD domain-containing protein [Granulosicoccaceae sp. 1_MG-2023]|nr:HDOD domain-containing protein [Granulosicoccaceae sp. 1_MG-2023]
MEKKNALIAEVEQVPLLSPGVADLLEQTSDPDFDLSDVVRIIRNDAMLTSRLLQIVNSAAFQLAVEVTTVDRAVSMLGTRMVVGVALGCSAEGIFGEALEGYESNGEGVWRHDLYCAIAARNVALKAKERAFSPDLAFTGGLLHDIGKTVASRFLGGTAGQLLEDIRSGRAEDYLSAEAAVLGLEHTWLGFELARKWDLPEVLQQLILHHHHPSEAQPQYRALCYAVHVGDILAMMAGQGTGADCMQYVLDPGFENYFDLKPAQLEAVLLESGEEFLEFEPVMALAMDQAPPD